MEVEKCEYRLGLCLSGDVFRAFIYHTGVPAFRHYGGGRWKI